MEFILIILSSFLFSIPLYQPTLFFLSWFAFIPMIYLINDYDYSHSFIIALLIGFFNSLFSLHWLYQPLKQLLELPASFNIFVLIIYFLISALPIAIWTLFNKFLQPQNSYSPVIAALSWSVLEFLRFKFININSFNYLAYSQSHFNVISKFAAYGGIFLVSFITVLIASYFVKVFLDPKWKKLFPILIIFLIIIFFPVNDSNSEQMTQKQVDLLTIDIAADNNFNKLDEEIKQIDNLLASSNSNYIFAAEKTISFDLFRNSYYRKKLYDSLKNKMDARYFQFGSYAAANKNYNSENYNSLFLLNEDLKLVNRYNKEQNILNAVNFKGRQKLLNYLENYLNFNYYAQKNKKLEIIKTNDLSYLNLMGEEIFIPFPAEINELNNNLNLIVNSATADKNQSLVYNNLSISAIIYKALESSTSVIRAAKNTDSAYVNSHGKLIYKGRLRNQKKTFNVLLNNNSSYYQKNPNQIIYILISLLAVITLIKIIVVIKNKINRRN